MNCKEVLFHLDAYVDRELSEKLVRELEEHFDVCSSCRSQLERIHKVEDLLDVMRVPPMPSEFAARVMAEARRRVPPARKVKFVFPLEWQTLRWFIDQSVPMRVAACTALLVGCLIGMIMSKEVSLSESRQTDVAETQSLDGFEWFNPAPPESLGSAYLTLMTNIHEDQGTR